MIRKLKRRERRETEFDTVEVKNIPVKILNISKTGMCVETDAKLEKNEICEISPISTTSTMKKKCLGRVAWRRKIDDPFSGIYRYGLYCGQIIPND